jgi:tetratricopeptide (TPR) repeat protein
VRYSAFISYNHRDRAWAAWLHRELERYRLPKALFGRASPIGMLGRRLPPVFQDREELAASTDLASSVREALGAADSLIVICSTNGARSRWVNEEVRDFISSGRGHRIQCLIVPEADDPKGSPRITEQVFPPSLLELGSEPLAADARNTGDGKRSAFLKVVAAVIGVRYDELRQREQARRHRRLAFFASAASVGFVAMTALTIFAFLSRSEAVRQRDLARQETMTAQRTTDFVKGLFEVSDPSEAKGKPITALEVLDRGARQIRGQLNDEPDVKAQLVSTLSEVYMGLGSYRRADDLIRASLRLPVARSETRARQLEVLATSEFLQGEYGKAAAHFERALEFVGEPENLQDVSLYGRLLAGKSKSLAALEEFDKALVAARQALNWDRNRNPGDTSAIARDLETIALAQQSAGDFEGSRQNYAHALELRLAKDGQFHPSVAEDLNQLGSTAYFQTDRAAAEAYFERSLALEQQVIGPNHPDLGITLNNLARVRIEQRKFARALPLLKRSATINLAQRGDTHDDLAFIFSNMGLAAMGLGKQSEAENLLNRALRAAQVHHNRLTAPIMVDLADLQCRRGDFATAFDQLARAAPIMKAQYPDDPWRTAWIDNTRGACLLRQGNAAAARPLLTSSLPVILKRWPADTMYGYEAQRRQRGLDAR